MIRITSDSTCDLGSLVEERNVGILPLQVNLGANAYHDGVDITPEKIISAVCGYFKYRKDELIGKGKKSDLVKARQICAYLRR